MTFASWLGAFALFGVGVAMFYGATRLVKRSWENLTVEMQKRGVV
jgi:hypothetical protein